MPAMIGVRCRQLLLCASMLSMAATAAARPPDFPAPKDAQVSSVAQEMTVAGRSMAVRAFVTDDGVDDVVDFYKDVWKEPPVDGAPGCAIETEALAPWTLVTRVEDDYVMTAQVMERKPKGAFGFLALGRLPEPGVPPKAPPAPPSMQGSEVLSNITSHDPGQSAQTAMLHNDKSLASNVSFYRAQYQDWRVDTDKEVSRGKLHALAFTRGREQVVITIQSGRDGSHIVLNSVKHDLL
ncbi:MAG: hypothetical protein IPM80_19020 [Proteobacteria bacterium]|nr:hypothetical protein [Pseudomonadota bacterium]